MNYELESSSEVDKQEDIDLIEIFKVIISGKLTIFSFTLLFAFFSIVYSLSLDDMYKSQTLQSFNEESNNSVLPSNLGNIASFAGINMPSQGENKSALVIETIKSREFFQHLISFEEVLPSIMIVESFDSTTGDLIFDETIYDSKNNKWIENSTFLQNKPTYLEAHKTYLELLNLNLDDKTGFLTISVEHLSPFFAKDFLELIINEVNALIRQRDLEESSEALLYLQTELTRTNLKELKDSINKLAQAQLERQMLAKVKKEYIIKSIDPPFVPELKSGPQRALICIFGTILGAMLGIFIVLSRAYLFR